MRRRSLLALLAVQQVVIVALAYAVFTSKAPVLAATAAPASLVAQAQQIEREHNDCHEANDAARRMLAEGVNKLRARTQAQIQALIEDNEALRERLRRMDGVVRQGGPDRGDHAGADGALIGGGFSVVNRTVVNSPPSLLPPSNRSTLRHR